MLTGNVRVFVATTPVDFRGSFERLSGFVREQLGDDPRSGALFVFLNRAGNRLKVLFFDQTGDCILYKRLDRGTFRGIIEFGAEEKHVEIDAPRMKQLLAGIIPPSRNKLH